MILENLRVPKRVVDIAKYMNVPRNTVKPHIRFLSELYLIRKDSNLYRLTEIGEILLDRVKEVEALMELIEKHGEFFSTHDLSSLPENLLMDIHMLKSGFIFSKTDPYELQKNWIEVLEKSMWIYGVSPVYHPGFSPVFYGQAKEKDVKLILTKEVFEKCKFDYFDLTKEFIETTGEIYVCEKATEAFWVSDKQLTLYLFRNGAMDPTNVFICETGEGIEWGKRLFDYYLKNSVKIDSLD